MGEVKEGEPGRRGRECKGPGVLSWDEQGERGGWAAAQAAADREGIFRLCQEAGLDSQGDEQPPEGIRAIT